MQRKRRFIPIILSICLVFGSFSFGFALETTAPNPDDNAAGTDATTEQAADPTSDKSKKAAAAAETAKPAQPQSISGAKMKIDNPYIEFNSRQDHKVTLTVPKVVADNDAAQKYAESIDWYLTRNKDDSPYRQDQTIKSYFKNIYTGDKLENWRKWGASGSTNSPLFTDKVIKGIKKDDGTVEVTLEFKNDFFLSSGWSGRANTGVTFRNLQGSVVGAYQLSAKESDGTVIKKDTMKFAPYKSYRTYMEVRDEVEKLIPAANAKGYDLKIEDVGYSEGGFPIYGIVFGKKGKSDHWLELTEQAETDPAGLQKKIDKLDYAIPMFMNNVHPDECPGSDTIVDTLKLLIENDRIDISQISSWKTADPGGYITPPIKDWATTLGRDSADQGKSNVEDRYNFKDDIVKVNQLLDDVFFVMVPNENVDGRISNGRRNSNGFDLNRDGTFQTQSETQGLEPYIAKWNPIVMNEYHGYVENFLIEPCTPPHEQNLEYDVTIEHFYKMSEVFGNTAIGSIRDKYKTGSADHSAMSKYEIPLRDYFDGNEWDAWDDLSTNYGPSYAMINAGTMGYTIEIPYNDQMSTDALTYGSLGMANYMADHKDQLFKNQLEVFKRGVENIDVSTEENNELEKYYYDSNDKLLEKDAWRTKFDGPGETGKFFPEYYVIPKDSANQRDVGDVNALETFLDRNDVKLKTLNKDTVIDGKKYKAGALVVDMHQAKRNYANAVLWQGVDAGKTFSALYSECVVNFPELRGFTCKAIAKENAIPEKNLSELKNPGQSESQLDGSTLMYSAVIVKNNGTEAVKAINTLLNKGTEVGMIEDGKNQGNFLIERSAWSEISKKFVLSGTGVKKADGTVKKLKTPTVYITGKPEAYTGTSSNTHSYWNEWFSDGYGSALHPNTMNSGTYEGTNYDREAYQSQMGFKVVDEPKDASIVVGSMALNSGTHGTAALNKVKAGTPYIATGTATFNILDSQIFPSGFWRHASPARATESLHYVNYEGESIITAPQRASGDDIIYNYGGGRIEMVDHTAEVLYKSKSMDENFHIAGCYPRSSLSNSADKVEAFTYQGKGQDDNKVDVTVFANSITRKAHQQDDYLFATNAIFSKHMGDTWAKYSSPSTDLADATVSKIADQVYSGKGKTPSVTVKMEGKTLKKDVDYTVSYSNNKAVGKATITIAGKGDYSGTKKITFKIIPKRTSISSIKAGTKKMTVKWKAVTGTTKYQVRYKTTTGSKWTTKTVSGKNTSLVVKKLTKNKKYHVQVRSYKTVSKAKYYSDWSTVKTSPKIK